MGLGRCVRHFGTALGFQGLRMLLTCWRWKVVQEVVGALVCCSWPHHSSSPAPCIRHGKFEMSVLQEAGIRTFRLHMEGTMQVLEASNALIFLQHISISLSTQMRGGKAMNNEEW